MTDFSIVARAGSEHQETHADALETGLNVHGITVQRTASVEHAEAGHVACWGWRTGQRLRELGKQVLVMERGYLGDRFAWTSLGWNGLNNRAQFGVKNDGGERFRRHFGDLLQPWNPTGDYLLIVGQVPGDASLQGRDLSSWYAEQAKLAAAMGLPARFRPHPEALKRGYQKAVPGADVLGGDLQSALRGAALVATWNSNTGVDALLAGKPVTVADPGSMVWEQAQGLRRGAQPDRESWAARLAWCQWSLDEIRSGEAWAVAGTVLAKKRVAA